ncbi:hypothetical protein I2F17_08880 [Acinetobacter sp. B10A]|uniref:hypothetical protein n=1 Tax=Acinetobacter baretiae TaxID=2605383 RepID=UPI001B3C7EA9|nr:hypothetical protein [Acinetobacter baretiae]MBF7685928.1 hypothetical protein [Acinetobacter baretiae]
MKKRTKKYNPHKRVQKLASFASQLHTLEMTFCVDEVNDRVDQWREENNIAERELTPKSVVYDVYHGDLIICLKNLLIPLEQEWFLGIDSHFFNYETEEVVTIPAQFTTPKMSFEEFRFGSETIKIDRGNGLKTRWKGINTELNEIIEADAPQGFERIRSDALFRVTTNFNSAEDYFYFKQAKSLRNLGEAA